MSFRLLLLIGLYASAADGRVIPYSSLPIDNPSDSLMWLAPNELFPQDAVPIWISSPKGVYVSVGTDRGFIGAAVSNATHLLLVDSSPQVVIYNRATIDLLKQANGDLEKFVKLRAELVNSRKFDKWDFRKDRLNLLLNAGHPRRAFGSISYVRNVQLFQKLTAMALEGRIQAEMLNLGDLVQVKAVVEALHSSRLPVSTLDFSNVHQYISSPIYQTLISLLRQVSMEDSLVMLTQQNPKDRRLEDTGWEYFASTMRDLESAGFFTADLSEIKSSPSNRDLLRYFKPAKSFAVRSCPLTVLGRLKNALYSFGLWDLQSAD